jgi:hypothetical protein
MDKNLQVKNGASKSRSIFTTNSSGITGISVQVSNPISVDHLISKGGIS